MTGQFVRSVKQVKLSVQVKFGGQVIEVKWPRPLRKEANENISVLGFK